MKRIIFRNIAIVTILFIVTLSIMLITNYFQVSNTTPLQVEVVETLKQLNDANANNPALQEQIRHLDLLARKAYFVRYDHLMSGVYILLGMVLIFVVCIRFYYKDYKNIPDKEIDPIDEWAIKTKARGYVTWGTVGIAAVALLFVLLSSPYLKTQKEALEIEETEMLAEATHETYIEESGSMQEAVTQTVEPAAEESTVLDPVEESSVETATTEAVSETTVPTTPQPTASTVTHNAFRGNTSNGTSAAKGVPVKWDLSGGTSIAWKKPVPRKGYNSPVINGNRVFFTGADNEARELYCYDLLTGEQIWSHAATNIPGSPAQMPQTTEDTGLAASTVATNGSVVCAIFATGDVLCADMQGNRVWAKNLGVPDNHYGYASSLLIQGNSLFIQYDNHNSPKVIALDLGNGNERWSKDRKERVTWSSPILASVGNASQLVLMGNPAITAYNPTNGEQLWRVECLTGEVGASACSSNGIIFGASEYSKLVAINATDGSLLWESNELLPEVSSPVATANNLYLATSYGVVASFDTKTGELKKEHDLGTQFYSSPVIVEGKIYLISNDGIVHIFSADDDFNLIDSFETGERTFATPAFTDGKIVMRTEQSIYCVATN